MWGKKGLPEGSLSQRLLKYKTVFLIFCLMTVLYES